MSNELIKRYLANELSNDERYAFELEMENDPFLKDAVDGFENFAKEDTSFSIEKTEKELFQQIDQKVSELKVDMNFFKYAAAACLVGIVAFSTWRFILQKNGTIDEQAIYASNFKPLTYPDGIVRGENDTTSSSKAAELYEKEDYFGAVKMYEKLVAANPDNIKNNLFYAISLMATNQPKKAIDILSIITTSEEFHFDINWYLALAYLKSKDLQNAQVYFQIIAKDDNYYQVQAKAILEKLDGKLAVKD